MPMMKLPVVTTSLGPNMSVSLPEKMLAKPNTSKDRDCAPEVTDLVHPKSATSGLKKTPKLWNVPEVVPRIMNEAMMIT